ncbi:4068_t:CDS:2, partial [Scutellospora calospora]
FIKKYSGLDVVVCDISLEYEDDSLLWIKSMKGFWCSEGV